MGSPAEGAAAEQRSARAWSKLAGAGADPQPVHRITHIAFWDRATLPPRWVMASPAAAQRAHPQSLRPRAGPGQVRAVVDLLPMIDVVPEDPFNSSPTDPKLMGPEALQVGEGGAAGSDWAGGAERGWRALLAARAAGGMGLQVRDRLIRQLAVGRAGWQRWPCTAGSATADRPNWREERGSLPAPPRPQRLRAGEALPTAQMRTPLVELPLGATEDRICGTIDIEKALTEGIKVGGRGGAGRRGGRAGRALAC